MSTLLLVPPVALTILLMVVWALSGAAGTLSFRRKGPRGALDKPYAGGETIEKHRVQVDYGQFFPFAFFFTILHVVALMTTTMQVGTAATLCIALIYVMGGFVGLSVLYRR